MKQDYIEITEYGGAGYRSLVEFGDWRVAVLNYTEELDFERLCTMQKHTESDEVFVLLSGRFMLFTGGDGETVGEVDGMLLEPGKLYNVKRGVWHTHTLSRDGSVLIVENRDTDRHGDSPVMDLTEEQIRELRNCFRRKAADGK